MRNKLLFQYSKTHFGDLLKTTNLSKSIGLQNKDIIILSHNKAIITTDKTNMDLRTRLKKYNSQKDEQRVRLG